MPLTLPTHPVVAVALKRWRPRWFDGVALTVGAVVPDIAFVADGYGVTIHSHAWHAPLWWALPLTLVATRLIRWAAPTIAAHLPDVGGLALRDYGTLGKVRHSWRVTTTSALVGAASHIGWDAFTHPTVDGGRVIFPFLRHQVWSGVPWWELLSAVSNIVGLVAGAAMVLHLGRSRLLRQWYGAPPPTVPRPVLFWPVVACVVTVGLATLPLHPVRLPADQAIRVMVIVAFALLAGAAVVRSPALTHRHSILDARSEGSEPGAEAVVRVTASRQPPER
ncbi:DUF4184 family protein [Plantactinospora sonchi]|uniref:DUF4184 family protein n=1 Tax=Plantactinospora sonchi TaxID=1544735 RepID=A0ABU7RS13_9ACTN